MLRWGLVVGALALGVLAVPLVGLAALPTGIVLAALLALRPPPRAPAIVGALGGAVGAYSAAKALLEVGGQPAYTSRLAFGIAAFLLALVATLAAPQVMTRPRQAGLLMLLAGTLGFLAINLFYINTWYGVGWLLLLLAGGWALAAPARAPGDARGG